jgi:hypothetical protein
MAMRKKKRTKARRRRRSNPGLPVLFANPRRKKAKKRKPTKRRAASRPAKRRRVKRRAARASHPVKRRRVKRRRAARTTHAAPRRRRRASKGRYRRVRRKLYTRRANPLRLKSIASTLRLMAFGGLGIIGARLGKRLYTKYASPMVVGTGGSTVRGYLNDALTIAAMAGFTYAIDMGLKKVPMVKPSDRTAYLAGGYAESGRHAIALVVRKIKPSLSLANYGLDGHGYDLNGVTGLETQQNFMGDLEPAESFEGMGDLELAESFEGPYDTSNI